MLLKEEVMANHLKNKYSDYVFCFIKKYIQELQLDFRIGDIGSGHYRNLCLFYKLGFKKLYALDKNTTDNPLNLKVNFKQHNIEKGLPYRDKYFDITLCNYVLMFIVPEQQKFVVQELLRVTNKFLIIETNRLKLSTKQTHFKEYNFEEIVKWISEDDNFLILDMKNWKKKECILVRRKDYWLEEESLQK